MADRKPKIVKKVVNIMTNPNPEFVSLVGHPANQSPFKAVKLDPTAIDRLAQAEASAELATRTAAEQVEVCKFLFDKNHFKSEETVRSYLDSRQWSDYSVKDSGKYFEVPNLDTDQFEGELEDIPAATGLTMTVGRVKKASVAAEPRTTVNPGTPPENAAPTTVAKGELVKKYDSWYAAWSNGTTMKDVMVDGYDGLPPGFWEVADAYFTALRNNLLARDESAVRSLSTEWTEIVLRLASVFKDLTPEQVERMTTKTPPAPAATPVAKGADEALAATPPVTPPAAETPPAAVAPATPPADPANPDQPNGETPVTDKSKEGQETGDTADIVTKAVKAALGTTLAGALQPVVTKLETSAADVTALREEVTKLTGRLDTVEAAQRQTRKSADIEDVVAPGNGDTRNTPDPEKAARMARREKREREGMLGIA